LAGLAGGRVCVCHPPVCWVLLHVGPASRPINGIGGFFEVAWSGKRVEFCRQKRPRSPRSAPVSGLSPRSRCAQSVSAIGIGQIQSSESSFPRRALNHRQAGKRGLLSSLGSDVARQLWMALALMDGTQRHTASRGRSRPLQASRPTRSTGWHGDGFPINAY